MVETLATDDIKALALRPYMLDRCLRRKQARRPPHRVVLSESKPPKFSLSFDTAEIEPGAYDVMLLPGGRWILGKVGCESHLELFCWDYFALNQEAEEDDTLLSPIARIRFEPFSLGDKEGYAKFYPSPQFDYIDKSVNILVHSPSMREAGTSCFPIVWTWKSPWETAITMWGA